MKAFWIIEDNQSKGWDSLGKRFTNNEAYITRYRTESAAEMALSSIAIADIWYVIQKYYEAS